MLACTCGHEIENHHPRGYCEIDGCECIQYEDTAEDDVSDADD